MTDEEKAAAELAEENNNDATEINEDDLLKAVSDAVDEETPGLEKKDDDETDDSTDDDVELDGSEDELEPGSEPGADDKTGDKEGEAEGKPEDKADDKSEEDGEDGSGDATKKTDDVPGDKKKTGDDDVTDVDHVNDPIPEATNEKTAARIKNLIGLVKDGNDATSQRDEIIEQINATGADPEQYSNTLGFLKLYNSDKIEDRKTALGVMRGMVKELALDVGEGASVANLQDHDDLLAEVEEGKLTEKRATEIAATRDRQKMLDSRAEAANAKTETDSQTAENVKTGRDQLDVLQSTLIANEKDVYTALYPAFIGLLKPMLKRTHPSDYGAVAREIYDQVKLANPNAGAKPTPKPKPRNTPLRPGSGAGGSSDKKVEGGDVMDAMNAAIENAY